MKASEVLDVAQWEFYVLPTAVLDARERSQHSITLKSLCALHAEPSAAYGDLPRAIEDAGGSEHASNRRKETEWGL